jgi:hypothetical protein
VKHVAVTVDAVAAAAAAAVVVVARAPSPSSRAVAACGSCSCSSQAESAVAVMIAAIGRGLGSELAMQRCVIAGPGTVHSVGCCPAVDCSDFAACHGQAVASVSDIRASDVQLGHKHSTSCRCDHLEHHLDHLDSLDCRLCLLVHR